MLSDKNAKKRAADVEEGEIGEESDAAGAAESEKSLTGVKAGLQDLVNQKTCFMGRLLMSQADLDALRLEGCFEPGVCRLPGKETTPKPRKNESVMFWGFHNGASAASVQVVCRDIGCLQCANPSVDSQFDSPDYKILMGLSHLHW
jgi:hypothetical protein